jgi:hypothetical protein
VVFALFFSAFAVFSWCGEVNQRD